MSTTLRTILARSLKLALGMAVALALGELGLRAIGFEYQFLPSKVQIGWPNPQELRWHFVLDADRLWVPKDYFGKVASWRDRAPDIVFMGDSCTKHGVFDRDFADEVADGSPELDPLSFVNLGISGWTTYQGLRQLELDVVPMKPKIITIYYGWNDHWISFGIEDKDIGQHNLDHTTLLRLSRLRIVQLVGLALTQKYRPGSGRLPERVSLEDFRTNLTEMIRIARANDILPILLTAPSSHTVGDEPEHLQERWLNDLSDLVPLHQSYVEVVREVALAEGADLLDLEEEFKKIPPEELKAFMYSDGIHLTDESSELIARLLYEFVRERGLLERFRD